MKYRKRKFFSGECMHIYQRTVSGFNIFYDREDFIVFFTIFSVISRLYDVCVLELCLMIDHIHVLLAADSLEQVSSFVRHYSSQYALEYNHSLGRHGPLFHKSFGSAPKKGAKKIRSTIVYIGNNPVEKKLCSNAPEYRWNFLAYISEAYPFSEAVPMNVCRNKLRKAMKEVRSSRNMNQYLTYAQLGRMFDLLENNEKDYLTDYIIRQYWPFDTKVLLSFYESCEDMFHAMKSTSGADHDIREMYHPEPDSIYRDMIRVVRNECQIMPARKVTVLPSAMKLEIARILRQKTSASMRQIEKFLCMRAAQVADNQ